MLLTTEQEATVWLNAMVNVSAALTLSERTAILEAYRDAVEGRRSYMSAYIDLRERGAVMTTFEVGQWYTNPAGTQTALMLSVTNGLAIIEQNGRDCARYLTELEGWTKVAPPTVKVGQVYGEDLMGGTFTVTAVGRDNAIVVHSRGGGEFLRPIKHLLRNYALINMDV